MSVVAICVSQDAPQTRAIKVLRPLTKDSISDIQSAIASGRPVLRRELWMNDFAEVADTLRAIVADLKEAGIEFSVTEEIQGVEEEITAKLLFNLLEDSESYR